VSRSRWVTTRRDVSTALFASTAGSALPVQRNEAPACTSCAQTALERAAGITPTNYAYLPGDVRRYGADPTGATDSTPAFRAACFSTYSGWSPDLNKVSVYVPSGKYQITNTVYVRSGICIFGAGMSTFIDASSFGAVATNVFKLGWGLISDAEARDAGGYPPEIAFMFFNGGPSGGGACVDLRFPGGLIHDCWFAAPGLGVYLAGGYLDNCEFDTGLMGLIIGAATNQTVTNCRFFNQNYAISFDASMGDVSDCIIDGCTIEYPKYVGVEFASAAHTARGIKLVGCDFINNPTAGVANFSNCVSIGLANAQIELEHCTFHNWGRYKGGAPFYALLVQAAGAIVDVKGCIFDGSPTNSTYAASTTAAAMALHQGILCITGTQIRNLPIKHGIGITYGGSATCTLQINGLIYSSIGAATVVNISNSSSSSVFTANGVIGDQGTPFINAQPNVPIKIRGSSDWFGRIGTRGSHHYVLLPYQASSLYMVTLTANQTVGGGNSYRKSICQYIEKDNDFSDSPKSFLSTATVVQGAANTNGLMSLTAAFGSVAGGTSIPSSNSGWLAIYWPSAYSFEQIDAQLLSSG
jgi:hypothetical protein